MTDKRPPLQYIPAAKTSFCLLPNQFDKNSYSRCNYVGNRTQIRCLQVRRKEDLSRSSGNCEIHSELAAGIKRRFEREKLHLENDCPPPTSKKFYRNLPSENIVCDEDPNFTPADTWDSVRNPAPFDDEMCRNPFTQGYGGVSTEKELLSMEIELLDKEVEMLEAYRVVHSNNSFHKISDLTREKSKTQQLSGLQVQSYLALKSYSKTTQEQERLLSLTTGPHHITSKNCIFGMEDGDIIGSVLAGILEDVSRRTDGESHVSKEGEEVFKCKDSALVGAELCLKHIHTDEKKKYPFSACLKCGGVILTDGQPLCPSHLPGAEKFKQIPKKPSEIIKATIDEKDIVIARKARELEKAKQKEASAKRARRVANQGSVSFTSVPPSAAASGDVLASHILSLFPKDDNRDDVRNRARSYLATVTSTVDSARCRPFHRDFFGKKYDSSSSGRATLPYGSPSIAAPQLTQNRVVTGFPGMLPSPSESARPVIRSSTQYTPVVRHKAPVPRVSHQERARNRQQIEEDKKAAASIADDRGELLSPPSSVEPTQFRAIVQSGTPQYRVVQKPPAAVARRSSVTYSKPSLVPSSSNMQIDLANLPEEMKNQPLGAVLKTGMNFVVNSGGRSTPPAVPQPVRMTSTTPRIQGQIRRPEIGSVIIPSRSATISVPSSQRHQIASVEVPPSRPAMVAPHRSARPMASIPTAPPPASAPPRNVILQPRVIPLERQAAGGGGHLPAILGGRRTPVTRDQELDKLDSPARSESKTPDNQRPDILRVRKPKESLPLPKIPTVVPRFRTMVPQVGSPQVPSKAPPVPPSVPSTSGLQLPKPPPALVLITTPSTSSVPAPVAAPAAVPQDSPTRKKERPAPRQGRRKSSRLDKDDDKMDSSEKDPLSLLADVSMAARQPSGNNSQDEDDYEEEL